MDIIKKKHWDDDRNDRDYYFDDGDDYVDDDGDYKYYNDDDGDNDHDKDHAGEYDDNDDNDDDDDDSSDDDDDNDNDDDDGTLGLNGESAWLSTLAIAGHPQAGKVTFIMMIMMIINICYRRLF